MLQDILPANKWHAFLLLVMQNDRLMDWVKQASGLVSARLHGWLTMDFPAVLQHSVRQVFPAATVDVVNLVQLSG